MAVDKVDQQAGKPALKRLLRAIAPEHPDMNSVRSAARKRGVSGLSMREIDAEIKRYREAKAGFSKK